ncbi:MAG TPA: hypothetical protein VFW19_11460 [Allosphingosinicella sp.]|nr:hypothetical protein [Allosphingosinicella sp.]
MSWLSYKLSTALAKGRRPRRMTREQILVDLLNKRAAARRAGLRDLERALREQIRWALPLRRADEADSAPEAGRSDP